MASEGDAGDAAAAGEDNNPWEAARDASSQLILQQAVEEIENRAAKQQEELLQSRQKTADLDVALTASQTQADELRVALQTKTEALDKLQLEYQGAKNKSESLQVTSKSDQERMDRLEAEADKLREEIR